jgi:hypothetical protein
MKYLIATLLATCLFATNATAYDAKTKALLKEQEELAPKLHECLVAIAKAKRNGNVWQEDDLSIDECKARAYESADISMRLLAIPPPDNNDN